MLSKFEMMAQMHKMHEEWGFELRPSYSIKENYDRALIEAKKRVQQVSDDKKQALIDRIAAYVMSHHRVIKEMDTDKMEAADTGLRAALKLFLNDASAADDFLEAIGSDFEIAKRPEGTYILKDEAGRIMGTVALNTADIPNDLMNSVGYFKIGGSFIESNTGNTFDHFIIGPFIEDD